MTHPSEYLPRTAARYTSVLMGSGISPKTDAEMMADFANDLEGEIAALRERVMAAIGGNAASVATQEAGR